MTNGKSKKIATKAKPKKKDALRAVRPTSSPRIDLGEHQDTLVALTDPFSSVSANARYPDQGSGRSLTIQQRYITVPAANASGLLAFAFNPKPNFSGLAASVLAGTGVTWTATYTVGDFSTDLMNTYGLSYRPTTAGIRIINTLSSTNSSGYLVLAKGGIPAVNSSTTFNPLNFSSFDYHSLVHGGEWHMTSHPRSAQAYDPDTIATGVGATYGDDSWESLYIWVSGVPASSTPLVIEVVMNFEYTAKEDAPIAALASAQPMMNIQMQTAINEVQSALPSSHKAETEKVSDTIKREAKKALIKHVLPFAAKKAKQLLL